MTWQRLNNVLHRDLGYFVVGVTMLYAVSGLALNHGDAWDPNFAVKRQEIPIPVIPDSASVSREWVMDVLRPLGEEANYQTHDSPSPSTLKIYLNDGSVFVNLTEAKAVYESVQRRPVLFQMNCLHVRPTFLWRAFSDLFAGSLIILAVTGLFVRRGQTGLFGRGAIFAAAGLVVPLAFLLFPQ
jgi:hypothetical protein